MYNHLKFYRVYKHTLLLCVRKPKYGLLVVSGVVGAVLCAMCTIQFSRACVLPS